MSENFKLLYDHIKSKWSDKFRDIDMNEIRCNKMLCSENYVFSMRIHDILITLYDSRDETHYQLTIYCRKGSSNWKEHYSGYVETVQDFDKIYYLTVTLGGFGKKIN